MNFKAKQGCIEQNKAGEEEFLLPKSCPFQHVPCCWELEIAGGWENAGVSQIFISLPLWIYNLLSEKKWDIYISESVEGKDLKLDVRSTKVLGIFLQFLLQREVAVLGQVQEPCALAEFLRLF